MPTYVYQCIEDDGSEGEIFEVVQPMSADPLTEHPETGQACRRIPARPTILGDWSDHATARSFRTRTSTDLASPSTKRRGTVCTRRRRAKGPTKSSTSEPRFVALPTTGAIGADRAQLFVTDGDGLGRSCFIC